MNNPKKSTTKDPTQFDKDADKTGSDNSADHTQTASKGKRKRIIRYDKNTREQNPDSTGIDTDADKTKGY